MQGHQSDLYPSESDSSENIDACMTDSKIRHFHIPIELIDQNNKMFFFSRLNCFLVTAKGYMELFCHCSHCNSLHLKMEKDGFGGVSMRLSDILILTLMNTDFLLYAVDF